MQLPVAAPRTASALAAWAVTVALTGAVAVALRPAAETAVATAAAPVALAAVEPVVLVHPATAPAVDPVVVTLPAAPTTTATTVPPTTAPPPPPPPPPSTTTSTTAPPPPPPTAPPATEAPAPPPPPAAPAPDPAPAPSGSAAAAEQQILEDHNARRASQGLPPLRRDACLDALARSWSAQMAAEGGLRHNPNYAAGEDRCLAWTQAGENVGVSPSVADLCNSFWASPVHRDNIVGPYQYVGIGVVVGSDGRYWATLDFASTT